MVAWKENYFTTHHQTRLFYLGCLPPEPKGFVIFSHGYGEHSGRYRHLMEYLAGRGYAAFVPDLRGHGRTARKLGDLENFSHAVDDLFQFKRYLLDTYDAHNVFLIGHSLGAALVLCLGARAPEAVRGAVLLSPIVIVPDHIPPLLVRLSRILALLVPRLPVMRVAKDNAFAGKDDDHPSHRDPYVYRGKMRARTGYEMLKAMEAVRADLPRFYLPQLVIHPGRDRINPRRAAELVHDRTRSTDKTFTVFPQACHNLLCEPERDEVLAAISAWIEARHPPAPAG